MTLQHRFLFPWNVLEAKTPVIGVEIHGWIVPEQELIFNARIED